MKKTVRRLTEKDLTRLVNKILNEADAFATHPDVGGWFDAKDRAMDDEPTDFDSERNFGPGDYRKFKRFISGCNVSWCLKAKDWFDRYAERGPITVRKKF